MVNIVISLGGSILLPKLEESNISPYIPVLQKISDIYSLFVVVGGGGEARRYISLARSLGVDDASADEIGILVTRLNATLLISALGKVAYPKVVESYTEALVASESGKIVVMGGVTPGQTTDAVAAVLAERVRASIFINLTSVDGIYSADPKTDPDARRYETITAEELLDIINRQQSAAGMNTVMDLVAVKLIERSKIPLLVMDGKNPIDLIDVLVHGRYHGTYVSDAGSFCFPIKDRNA